jgi:hypothetical protein
MSTDYAKDILAGNFLDDGNAGAADAAAKACLTVAIPIAVGAAGTAGTPLAESEHTPINFDAEVLSAYFVSATAVAQDPTNTATFVLSKFDAAGANKTTVASKQTLTGGGGSVTAKAGYQLTLAAGAQYVVKGGSFAVEVTKQGAGVATGAGNLVVTMRQRNV